MAEQPPPVGELCRRPKPRSCIGGADRFELQLLGPFRLAVNGCHVELPTGAQRLVALLALRGRMTRSRLAGTLWPDTLESKALASLRTGIWRINNIASQLILARGESVEVDANVQVDVRDFIHSATAILQGAEANSTPWLEVAHDSELLIDWTDNWLIHDRERVHQLQVHFLENLSERLANEGRFGLAVEAALAALRRDFLRETAHRAVIRAYMAEGNVCEARRAYESCVQVLARELGVAPAAATTILLQPHANLAANAAPHATSGISFLHTKHDAGLHARPAQSNV